jgi:hypothetical protein
MRISRPLRFRGSVLDVSTYELRKQQSPAGVERFIEEAGRRATDLSVRPASPELPELERIVAIAQKHGIEVPLQW